MALCVKEQQKFYQLPATKHNTKFIYKKMFLDIGKFLDKVQDKGFPEGKI